MRTIAIISLVLLGAIAHGQELSYRQYSVKDGLPGSTVYHTLQDANGFLWFATNQGVSRFDGRTFRSYSKEDGLPDDEVIKLYLDRHNNIWFISLLGIPSVFHNDSIIRFDDCRGIKAIAEDALSDSILLIGNVEKKVGYTYGIYRSLNRPGHWKFSAEFRNDHRDWPVLRVSSPAKINFYFVETGQGKSKLILRTDVWEAHHSFTMNHGRSFTPQSFFCLTPDKRGIVFCTMDSLYHADGDGIKPILSLKEFKLTKDINSIYCENDSTLWLSTTNQGLLRIRNFLKEQKDFRSFFSGTFCTSITKDHEDGYWVTTHSDGVYYLPNLRFHAVSAYPELATKDVRCVRLLDRHTIGAGFADGNIMLIDTKNARGTLFSEWTAGNRNKRILGIHPSPPDRILVGGDAGIFSFSRRGDNQKVMTSFAVKEVFSLPDTTLLIGYSAGIISSKNTDPGSRLFSGRVTCISGIGWQYYWGTQRGVYTFSNDSLVNLGEKFPELSGIINHIDFAPDSSLWASTQEGIAVLKRNRVTMIRKEQGILSNICKHVSFDKSVAWVSTNKGISRIDYRWRGHTLQYSISNITEEDGLTANDVNQTTPGGSYIWAATARGISFFSKDHISRSVLRPLINITRIVSGERTLPVNDTITVTYPENTLRIELSGISYRSGKQIQYEYRLKGIDDHWTSLVNNTVEFSALPFGEFIFEVQAVDRWGQKSDTPKQIAIINMPPFWKSTLFYLLTYLALATMLGAGFYVFHKKQHRKKELEYQLKKKMHELEMKALQAQINPHFIFNCLTSIQYHIMRADMRNANTYLHKFSTLIRQTLQHSTASTILLREEIKILSLYLELEKLRMGERMDYDIQVSENVQQDELFLPSMIIQPYVENAVKHGIAPLNDRKGKIGISIEQAGGYIECTINDNGPGINASRKNGTALIHDHVSMGTTITASRIHTINASQPNKIRLTITDKLENGFPESGTIVQISFPILTD